MKVNFLSTAAVGGVQATFRICDFCEKTRKLFLHKISSNDTHFCHDAILTHE